MKWGGWMGWGSCAGEGACLGQGSVGGELGAWSLEDRALKECGSGGRAGTGS